ncbi:hypothetical protein MHYP_G00333470 [Metynnis hypsauchen]
MPEVQVLICPEGQRVSVKRLILRDSLPRPLSRSPSSVHPTPPSCVHSILCLRMAVMCRDTKRGQPSSPITFHQHSLPRLRADRLMEVSRLLAFSTQGN